MSRRRPSRLGDIDCARREPVCGRYQQPAPDGEIPGSSRPRGAATRRGEGCLITTSDQTAGNGSRADVDVLVPRRCGCPRGCRGMPRGTRSTLLWGPDAHCARAPTAVPLSPQPPSTAIDHRQPARCGGRCVQHVLRQSDVAGGDGKALTGGARLGRLPSADMIAHALRINAALDPCYGASRARKISPCRHQNDTATPSSRFSRARAEIVPSSRSSRAKTIEICCCSPTPDGSVQKKVFPEMESGAYQRAAPHRSACAQAGKHTTTLEK